MAAADVLTAGRVRRLLANAVRSDGFRRFGFRFAYDYARIAWHAWRHWGDGGSGSMQLLGWRIKYPNHSAALFLVHEVFVNGVYAFEARAGGPRIVDCGANIGMSVLFFKSLYPDATVLAFEPDPRTFARLEENVHANRLTGVRMVNAALARTPGSMTLYSDPAAEGSLVTSLDRQRGGGVASTVRAVTLSTFIDGPIDFLKVDIEGAEYDLIEDLFESGAVNQVNQMAIEVHADASGSDRRPALRDRLETAGFDVRVNEMDDQVSLLRASRLN